MKRAKLPRQPILLAEFLAEYKDLLPNDIRTLKLEASSETLDIQRAMKLLDHNKRFEQAERNCAISKLDMLDDARIAEFKSGRSEIRRKARETNDRSCRRMNSIALFNKVQPLKMQRNARVQVHFRRSRETYTTVPLPDVKASDQECLLYDDLVVTVRVCCPARITHIRRSMETTIFSQEIECLGSSFLSELRDTISCLCNGKRFFNCSENPKESICGKDSDPGFFFITKTFYNDTRNPQNPDYSEFVLKWAKANDYLGVKELKTAKMDETRFSDLDVSIGSQQLYLHHGNCEHVFFISQVEVLSPSSECIKRCQYPRVKTYNVFTRRPCYMCGRFPFVYVLEESDQHLQEPVHLCRLCLLSFHYIDGKKVDDFKAFRMHDFDDTPLKDEPYADTDKNSAPPETDKNSASLTTKSTRPQSHY